jgi:2-polyprenyl-6-methoxyphenol hydroxylase-like FAD-dependent oxidoreductase
VHLSDGTILETDMIIGADGQHSTVRLSFQKKAVKPSSTGTVVLSANVPMDVAYHSPRSRLSNCGLWKGQGQV